MNAKTKKAVAAMLCLLLSCAHTPQAALDAEKLGSEQARAFCISKHTGVVTAAASCAELCVEDGLTTYCARKKCALELGTIAAWDDVADFCAKYTPPLYYPRPEWPPKGLTPIVEEDT